MNTRQVTSFMCDSVAANIEHVMPFVRDFLIRDLGMITSQVTTFMSGSVAAKGSSVCSKISILVTFLSKVSATASLIETGRRAEVLKLLTNRFLSSKRDSCCS